MQRKNIVFEALCFGFRTLVEHICLFVMMLLAGTGFVAVAGGLIALINKGFIQKILSQEPLGMEFVRENSFSLGASLLISVLIMLIVFIGLYLGLNKVALALHAHGKSSVKEMFSCFALVPKAFLALIVYSIILSIGFMLLILPGIIAFLRLSLFPYFIIDQNAGPIESLKMSYEATKNHTWQAFTLCFAVTIITTLLKVSVIGNVVIVPFTALVYACFYRSLVSHSHQ